MGQQSLIRCASAGAQQGDTALHDLPLSAVLAQPSREGREAGSIELLARQDPANEPADLLRTANLGQPLKGCVYRGLRRSDADDLQYRPGSSERRVSAAGSLEKSREAVACAGTPTDRVWVWVWGGSSGNGSPPRGSGTCPFIAIFDSTCAQQRITCGHVDAFESPWDASEHQWHEKRVSRRRR
jgi:hypothetical protein